MKRLTMIAIAIAASSIATAQIKIKSIGLTGGYYLQDVRNPSIYTMDRYVPDLVPYSGIGYLYEDEYSINNVDHAEVSAYLGTDAGSTTIEVNIGYANRRMKQRYFNPKAEHSTDINSVRYDINLHGLTFGLGLNRRKSIGWKTLQLEAGIHLRANVYTSGSASRFIDSVGDATFSNSLFTKVETTKNITFNSEFNASFELGGVFLIGRRSELSFKGRYVKHFYTNSGFLSGFGMGGEIGYRYSLKKRPEKTQ